MKIKETISADEVGTLEDALPELNTQTKKQKTRFIDTIKSQYKDSVDSYLRNGCTEFHKAIFQKVGYVLKELGVTPFELVRLYNEIWQPWYEKAKNNPKIKKHFQIEDMSRYCPQNECSECQTPLCDRFRPVYEGCNCDECEATRKEIREMAGKWKT